MARATAAAALVLRAVHLPITVVMIQMAFTAGILCVAPCGLHFGSLQHVIRWSVTVPWLFTAMLTSSMLALRHSSMGAIVVLRNVAPLVSMAIEGVITGERIEVDGATILSLLLILGGVGLYVSNDVAFSPTGVAWMAFNMTAGVLERLLQRRMIAVEPVDINKTGLMLLNNVVSLLPMSVLVYCTGEVPQWRLLARLSTADGMLLLASCVNAVAISWAGINAQAYVTATTFMVLANLNKFVVVAFGIAVLHEASSWQAVVGCGTSLLGGAAYARARSNLASRPTPVKCSEAEADDEDDEKASLQPA
ncbi:hypothetical protein EMIHUDRAFT_121316 [Emiliania huxleyi CCMP1516]|uniref:Sugar phosphate transporter domain-containing protein n=2 Tax=Emiliania huxleyi TaxID=2903 RepID=A0A0D3I4W3_EMIH1|nr:hypothetical protein EMIHUDRAFT_121316 [Emiliania huxleyi CCMP1516]EOD06298.1 hypothetical protein EMIHUDRAFT_121316 [Emiliania huxleyi CCMP1516]|eukprot:XP_005758727.1 hypothetical protein EMIHUDRAFT_121316 [Emiliania huxleyi CCMP1516]